MQFYRHLQKVGLIVALVLVSEPALATQVHNAPEGLYAHQLAHIFFIISMGVLIYWLRERKLVQVVGWRYIQYAALFFILWNVDAFGVHMLEEQIAVIDVRRIDPWKLSITAANHSDVLIWFYYAAKLDHLLCVPALLLLYFGLRRLLKDTDDKAPGVMPS